MKIKTTILTLLFLLLLPSSGFAQTSSSIDFKKLGVGIGYSSSSVIGDSIRPVKLSFRYRIGDKHTVQLYTPLSYKRSSIRHSDDTRKETLWGLGLGYDYTFHTYTYLDFFVGLNTDYQWYQTRHDSYYKYPIHNVDGTSYEIEETYYFWHKVNGLVVNPNIGTRLSFGNITSEVVINIPFSKLKKEAYSFYEEIVPAGKSTSEKFYPDNKINKLKLSTNISINIAYYF